jgi:hypothetical protein
MKSGRLGAHTHATGLRKETRNTEQTHSQETQ